MTDTVLVALIALLGTLGGSFAGILTANKLTNYRIEQLEKKVESHNQLVERTYQLEERMQVADERMKVLNHRMQDLERKDEKG